MYGLAQQHEFGKQMRKTVGVSECQQITSGLAKLGGKVTARTSVRPLTVSDNPNCVQLRPNFAKPPGRWQQPARTSSSETPRKESTA